MKTYIVLEPIKNVRTGQAFAKGDTVELDPTNGQVRAWLHFKQIEEKPEKPPKPLTKKEQEAADKAAAENGGGN